METNIHRQLSPAVRKFVEKYIECGFVASTAYHELHPTASAGTCRVNGHKLITRPEAQDYLHKYLNSILEGRSVNAERIALELSEMAFNKNEATRDRLGAINLLQKQLGLQQQNVKAEVDNKVEISVNIEEDID